MVPHERARWGWGFEGTPVPVALSSRTSRISASPRYRAVRPDGRTGDGCLEFVAESLRAFAVPAGALDHGTPKELNSQLDSIIRPRSAIRKGDEAHASDGKLVLNSDRHAAAHREAQAAQCGQWVVGMFPLLIVHLQSSSDDCHRPPRPSIGRSEAFRTTRETASGETDRSKTQSGTAASCGSRFVGIHVAFELRHVEATRLLCTCEAARIRPRRRHRYLRTTEPANVTALPGA